MRHKIIMLILTFVVLFSLQGLTQTTEKSKHPLMDKYYPPAPKSEASKTVTSQKEQFPETKPEAVTTTSSVPVVAPKPAEQVLPTTSTSAPITTDKPGLPAISATTILNKPTTVTVPTPMAKVVAPPAPYVYSETRLGSSTKQYDTWEKNNNGAGSVTTSTK